MMQRRMEMEPESGARRHVEKATADELQGTGKAGISPIEYFGKEAKVMLSPPASSQDEIEGDSRDSPASVARRNPEQVDALARSSMYMLAQTKQEGRQPFQGTTFRCAADLVSAGHVVITDYIEGFEDLHAYQRRSCGIDVYKKLWRKKSDKLVKVEYTPYTRRCLQAVAQYQRQALLPAPLPFMRDPVARATYPSLDLATRLNPDFITMRATFSEAHAHIRRLVPGSLDYLLSSCSPKELRKPIAIGGAGYPSVRKLELMTRRHATKAYPEAIVRYLQDSPVGTTVEAAVQALGHRLDTIFQPADQNAHVFSTGRLLNVSKTMFGHTANGLPRFSGAPLAVLGVDRRAGIFHGIHVAPAVGDLGEWNVAVHLDSEGVAFYIVKELLAREDPPGHDRWRDDVYGRGQYQSWFEWLRVNLPKVLLNLPPELRDAAFEPEGAGFSGRRNEWLQVLVEDVGDSYWRSLNRGCPVLTKDAVACIEKNEALRDLVVQLSGVPSGRFEDFRDAVEEKEYESVTAKAIIDNVSAAVEAHPVPLSCVHMPAGVTAKNWKEFLGFIEALVTKYDGRKKFRAGLPEWPKAAAEEVALGIYQMEAALEARKKQRKKVDDAIADIRRKLRNDPSVSDEQLDDKMEEEFEKLPLTWTMWHGPDRIDGLAGAMKALDAGANYVLDHKNIKLARPNIPLNLDVGEKTRLEAELHSVGLYQIALDLMVEVLQADYTNLELEMSIKTTLQRKTLPIKVHEAPDKPKDLAEVYRTLLQFERPGFRFGKLLDVQDDQEQSGRPRGFTIEVVIGYDEDVRPVPYAVQKEFLASLEKESGLVVISSPGMVM